MENTDFYQVIADLDALNDFINWLPPIQEHEKFYCCLFSRRKYHRENSPHGSADKNQLRRFLSNKERLLEKIQQLECRMGAYKWQGQPVHQASIAMYITPNPRDLIKANTKSIIALAKNIQNNNIHANPHQEVMSEIHRTPAKKSRILFDIDDKDPVVIEKAMEIVDGNCDVIETRGGFHLHVIIDKIKNIPYKFWYNELKKLSDVSGDEMTPVVGCYQGGFVPRFHYRCRD